jgi:hypothetical protein
LNQGIIQAELTIIFEQLCAGGEGSTRANLINKLLSRGIFPGLTPHLRNFLDQTVNPFSILCQVH